MPLLQRVTKPEIYHQEEPNIQRNKAKDKLGRLIAKNTKPVTHYETQ